MSCTDAGRVTLGWDTIDPTDDVPYSIDYSDLLDDADTIVESTWQPLLVDGGGSVTLTTHDPIIIAPDLVQTQVWVRNGSAGQSYAVVNSIVTANGTHLSRSFGVSIRCM